jgi:hypothetical protein
MRRPISVHAMRFHSLTSSTPLKNKAPNHEFRVSTDPVRRGYLRARAAAMAGELAAREQLAAAIGDSARVMPRDDGYVLCPSGSLGVEEVVREGLKVVDAVDLEQKKAKANKPFMVKLAEMDDLTLESPLMKFALRRDVVATAAHYLGVVPILQYANVMYSSHAAAEPAKSQLHHCDSDEAEQVKVFVLCAEVTPRTGPLTFIPASLSQEIRDRVDYEYNTRLTDQRVRDVLGNRLTEVALTGPPGTTAFVDTSRCFHYGSRFADPNARRVLVMLQYVTPLAFILPADNYLEGARFRRLATPAHDELTSMVLGAV